MELWPAFLIGFFGSLHCIGMCGPIVLALPGDYSRKIYFLAGRIIYNAGRILSYTAIGLLLGLFGRGFSLFGFQRYLSVALGIFILAALAMGYLGNRTKKESPFFSAYNTAIKSLFARFIRNGSLPSMFFLGVLNGLLPCGLVYVAAAGAVVTSGIFNSAFYMILFGLGTLPAMLFAAIFGRLISLNIRKKLNRLVPYFVSAMAFILILRGLNLGIPMLSPKEKIKSTQPAEHQIQKAKSPAVPEADCCK
ncbi:MAG: sulfite exporter TauE/SafE family protein [Syntrophothermus sp.]